MEILVFVLLYGDYFFMFKDIDFILEIIVVVLWLGYLVKIFFLLSVFGKLVWVVNFRVFVELVLFQCFLVFIGWDKVEIEVFCLFKFCGVSSVVIVFVGLFV